ncbi:hypothetical protein FB45DRAFT_907905 [Roridomyces roridus]|uniref:Carbohydrate-binding module family 19 domain-containing protein n=1 Tax=Roridomyces roridus TaxID=1738132 RepID=A0AAD7C2L6_9AGAR|nr:hypothetical protein FB45DRAFT_907905 [Roridomyces roridus]
MSVALTLLASLAISATAAPILPNSAAPQPYVENAITAQFFNQQFAAMAETDPCTGNQTACVNGAFAMCVEDEWVITPCASGLVCAAVPQSSTVGYVLSCDTTADIEQHFAFAGIDSGLGNATGNATTSALPVAPTASANATLAPVRRFHPRQLSVNVRASFFIFETD